MIWKMAGSETRYKTLNRDQHQISKIERPWSYKTGTVNKEQKMRMITRKKVRNKIKKKQNSQQQHENLYLKHTAYYKLRTTGPIYTTIIIN